MLPRWTLTLDVLKHFLYLLQNQYGKQMNLNIGCIETVCPIAAANITGVMNLNIGCIETQ